MKNLLIFPLSGQTYGVWEDDIAVVRDGLTLHRLPLSPDAVAGMTIINDRSATFADIGACLGLPAMTRSGQIHCLLLGEQEKLAGFAVEGTLGKLPVASDAVLSMPAYLSTPVVSSCALHAGALIPIVNLKDLYLRIRSGQLDPVAPSLAVPGFEKHAVPSPGDVRIIRSGGETFAVPRAGTEKEIADAGTITRLPLVPEFVTGVAPHRGEAIPVIHLGRRMALPQHGVPRALLVTEIGGNRYGFFIDGDGGPLPSAELSVKPQPPLARCAWMEAAVLAGGEIIPLIDPVALIALSPAEQNRPPLPERYTIDSAFADIYLKENVAVTEFVLLGARHALPKSEVADSVPLRDWRAVPNVQPIVIGVADHDGRLLPVLDLAMIFGRRSITGPEWRMVLVKNGDFEAFVVTGAVYAPKRIAPENQRAVPIVLPHRVVYGCYPDGGTVKLVLNVAALTVHFDKALVKEFMGAISREMAEAPAELVHALLPEEHLAMLSPEEAAAASVPPSGTAAATLDSTATAEEHALFESEAAAQAEAEERSRREGEERARMAAEQAAREAEEQARREAEEQARREAEEREQAEARAATEAEEKARLEAEETARREAEEQARREAGERAQAAAAATAEAAALAREAEGKSQQAAEERAQAEAEEQARREGEERARMAAEQAAREAEEQARREAEERERATAEARAAAEAAEKARLESEETARREAEEQARREADERAQAEAAAAAMAEAAALAREAEEKAKQEATERAQAEIEERSRREEEERTRIAAEQAAREAEEQARREAEERARREAEEKARQEAEERSRREAEERSRAEAERRAREEAEAVVREAGEIAGASGAGRGVSRASLQYRELTGPVLDLMGKKEQAGKKPVRWRWSFLVFVLAVIIVGLLYFAGIPRQPMVEVAHEERGPVERHEEEKTEPARPAPEPESESGPEESLVLTVPKDMPIESDVYVVKKGDTLWAISKRFTGNPFNYPRVARDNKIANADLIFPDQKIRIKRQE